MTWLTGIPSAWKRCAIGVNDYDHLSIVLDTLIAHYPREKHIREKHFDLTPFSSDTTSDAKGDDPASTIINGQDFVVPKRPSPGYDFDVQDYFQGDPTKLFQLYSSNTKEGIEFKVLKKGPPLGLGQGRSMSEVATHEVQLLRERTFPDDTLLGYGYSQWGVMPSAFGSLVAFPLSLVNNVTDMDAICSQIVIWDYVSDEIIVKIPIMVTSSYRQEEDDQAASNGIRLPVYGFVGDTRSDSLSIFDCWSVRLLSDSSILVTGRNECTDYVHEDHSISSVYIYSFAKGRWSLDKKMPGSCEIQGIYAADETTGTTIRQADVYIDKDEHTTVRLLGLIDTRGKDTWTDTLQIVDRDRYLNKLGNRARCFHPEYPRCLGDFESAIDQCPIYHPTFDCPYIAGWRAVCGSGFPINLSANLEGEPAAGMRWTNILYYDFCPGIASRLKALSSSIKSHLRVHVQQASYLPKNYDYFYGDGSLEEVSNDRFAEKGIGITIDGQDSQANDREWLPFLQIRVQTFSDMPNLDVKAIAIWQGGLLLLGEKESLILYFDEG